MIVFGGGPPGPLMTTRTALILTIAVLAGVGAGALLQFGAHRPAEAVLGGVGTFIAALKLMHEWIAPDRGDRKRR